MFGFLKSKKPEPFNYELAMATLYAACKGSTAYSLIMPSLYYDAVRNKFVVHFECAMREYVQKSTKNRYFLSFRRSEKVWGPSLRELLEFAIEYAERDDAFRDNNGLELPEGFSISVKNINRIPGGHNKSKWNK